MTNPTQERPRELEGKTYKLTWTGETGDETHYVTITHREVKGKLRPWEIFFNSKNVTHYPWMVALARMMSAVFQRGENVSFVADELQEVFDPRGFQMVGNKSYKSLLDLIGKALEEHMVAIGYIKPKFVVDPRKIDIEALTHPKPGKVIIDPAKKEPSIYQHFADSDAAKAKGVYESPTSAKAIGEAAAAVERIDPTTDDDFDVRGL